MKKVVLLFGILLMSYSVLAEISMSEPDDVYNLGDRLYISVDGLRGSDNGNLNIDLICENKTINLVKIPARAFSSEEDQSYSIPYKILNRDDLEILNLDDIIGTCQVISSLGTGVSSSKTFEISNDVDVLVSLDKGSYNPGEGVTVKIEATKENGAKLNGFIEGMNSTSFNRVIEEGFASEVFVVPETLEAGTYVLGVKVYDVGVDGILNTGMTSVQYEVNQVPTSLILSLSDVVATPGEDFSVGVEIYDQAGKEMEGVVFLQVISPDGKIRDLNVNSGESVDFDFDFNSSIGTWGLFASFDDLEQAREFEMAPVQKVGFDFEGAVLIVRNIGNVLYNRTIDVNVGEEVLNLDLNIKVGEVRKFSVGAPDGEYDVLINDGETSISRSVLLTGNAISLKDFKNGGLSLSFVWFFLILIFGFMGGTLIFRYKKTRKLGEKSPWNKVPFIGKIFSKSRGDKKKISFHKNLFKNKNNSCDLAEHEEKNILDLTKKNSMQAESSLVLKGEKNVSSVVALNIKNYDSLNEQIKKNLVDMVSDSKGKGIIDWRGDFVFVVFSPLVTKTYGNDNLAVKCAMGILGKLNDYNRRFKSKVEFGIGVHSGDMIASKSEGKLKYTGVGNTISFARRLAELKSGKVVVSDVVRKKMMRDLRAVKAEQVSGKDTYVVEEVLDRSGDAAKLKQLLGRQDAF